MIWLWTKFLLNGQELRSTFERNREMIKKHPPSRSPGELYGDLLEDLDPASGLSSWIDIPVPHALCVSDMRERRLFLQFPGRFIAATISLLARISSSQSTCRGVAQFAAGSRLRRWQILDAFRDDHAILPCPNRAPTNGSACPVRSSENGLPIGDEIPLGVLCSRSWAKK